MKILVTGGAGFIGSNLVEYLLNNGHSVRVLDNFSTGSKNNLDNLSGPLEIMEGCIENEKDCQKACADGVEAVSHQAAYGSVPRSIQYPSLYSHINLHGFVNMATAARDAGIQRFVYASSSSVYGDLEMSPKVESKVGRPLSPYAASKAANELFAHSFANFTEMTFIGFRYFNVFGPKQSPKGAYAAVIPLFVDALMKNKPAKIFSDGEQSRDFTFVSNVVQANVSALTSALEPSSKVYNIACGTSTSVNELYRIISNYLGKDIQPEYLPPRVGDVRNSLANVGAAQKDLNYNPAIELKEGLEQTVQWFKDTFYSK